MLTLTESYIAQMHIAARRSPTFLLSKVGHPFIVLLYIEAIRHTISAIGRNNVCCTKMKSLAPGFRFQVTL